MRKRRLGRLWRMSYIALLVWLCSPQAMADEVILANGDRLTGRIVDARDEILTLETGYSEPVKLQLEAVRQMSSTEPLELHLTSGEILKGKVAARASRQIEVAAGPDREAVVVGLDNIAALNPPPKKPATWKGTLTLGGNWQDGNTETMNISAGGSAVRRSANDRFTISLLYNKAEDDGVRSAESTYGQLKYDYFVAPQWYLYMNVDMLADEFQDINLRTSVGPGIGYQIWEEENKVLAMEAGIAYTSEDRDAGEDTDWISARLGVNFRYKVFDKIIFKDQLALYPSLDDTGEYTLRNEADLITDIGASWALKLSNIWERDSDPGPDLKKDDFTWILGVQYSF